MLTKTYQNLVLRLATFDVLKMFHPALYQNRYQTAYRTFRRILRQCLLCALLTACLANDGTTSRAIDTQATPTAPAADADTKQSYQILARASHDTTAFTQGYDYENGVFYESSGLYGKSFITSYDARKTRARQSLEKRLFAEGLVKLDEELYVLTWKAGKLQIYDSTTLSLLRSINYSGEGWGLSYDGDRFVMSDGSAKLYYRDRESFDIIASVIVHDDTRRYAKLNELEYAKNHIWANVWMSPYILKIRATDGYVVRRYDLTKLVLDNSTIPNHTVLNGIAYDEKNKAFWVTGKKWPTRYLIRFSD